MVFDPMKFYDDGQRRQKRYDILVPVFVVAIVLLVVFGAAFVAYQRSHVKPKPEQWVYQGRPCKGTDCREAIADDEAFTCQCSGGQCVTNLKDCPEYKDFEYVGHGGYKPLPPAPRKHKRKPHEFISFTGVSGASNIESYNPHAHVTLEQLRHYQQEVPSPICILNITSECWVTLDPDPKPDCLLGGSVKGDIPPCGEGTWYYRPHAPEVSPTVGICDLVDCGYSDHIWQPVIRNNEDLVRAEKAAEYDQLVLDHSEDFYDNVFVPGGECTDRERYRELQCVSGGNCKLRNKDANWCLDRTGGDDVQRANIHETTPQDIADLMEKISPTPPQQKDFEFGAGSGTNSFTICTKANETGCIDVMCEGRNIGEGCPNYVPPSGAPVQYWTPGGTKRVPDWRIIKNPDGTCEREETWPDVGSGGRTERMPVACQKPDCKMPADVDVCPTQTLESKGISDKGVDLKKYGVRDGKAKP